MDIDLVVLRALHIVAAAFWVGASLSFAYFIEPASQQLGPGASAFMSVLNEKRHFPVVIAVLSVVAIVAGGLLYWRNSSGLEWEWVSSPTGTTFSAGAAAAIAAWLIGFFVLRPGIGRSQTLAEAAATDSAVAAELDRLGRRLRHGSLANAWLLVSAAIAMAIARYV